jgi:hypothetical protein
VCGLFFNDAVSFTLFETRNVIFSARACGSRTTVALLFFENSAVALTTETDGIEHPLFLGEIQRNIGASSGAFRRPSDADARDENVLPEFDGDHVLLSCPMMGQAAPRQGFNLAPRGGSRVRRLSSGSVSSLMPPFHRSVVLRY